MNQNTHGFMAITSLLIISAVTMSIAISMSIIGISQAQNSLTFKKGQETLTIAKGCLENTLQILKTDPSYPGGTLNIDAASCNITVTSTGANKAIEITAILSGPPDFTKKISATARTTGTSINLINWQEI